MPESLKNVLLVMHASGFLVPPHQPRTEEQVALWDATFDRLDIFLPQLRQELFPTAVAMRNTQLSLQPQPARSPSPSPALPASDTAFRSPRLDNDSDSQAVNLQLYM